MPLSNAFAGTFALDRETTFQAGIADWDALSANGGLLCVFDVDVSGVRDNRDTDKNMKQRQGATHAPYKTLKNCTFGFGMYSFGNTSHAAAGAPANDMVQDEIFQNSLGGVTLSYHGDPNGAGTATAPQVAEGTMDGTPGYGWVFHYDTSAGSGRFCHYVDVTDGGAGMPDTVNMRTGFSTLGGAPDAADEFYGVASFVPHWDIMDDYTNASHLTHTVFVKYRGSTDNHEAQGVKFSVGAIAIEAGKPMEFAIGAMAPTFTNQQDIVEPTLAGTPEGSPGKPAGQGTATLCYLADDDAADLFASTQQFWDVMTITPGIEYEAQMGPNGQEGVHGYHPSDGSYDGTVVEVKVPYDTQHYTDYDAGKAKQLFVQIGDQPDDARFVYLPKLAWNDRPERTDVGGRAAMVLRFIAQETDVDISALSALDGDRAKSKIHFGRVG